MNLLVRSLSPSGQQQQQGSSSSSPSTPTSPGRRNLRNDRKKRKNLQFTQPTTSYQPHMLFDIDADPQITDGQRRATSLERSRTFGPLEEVPRSNRSWFSSRPKPSSPEANNLPSFDHFEYFYNFGRSGQPSPTSPTEDYLSTRLQQDLSLRGPEVSHPPTISSLRRFLSFPHRGKNDLTTQSASSRTRDYLTPEDTFPHPPSLTRLEDPSSRLVRQPQTIRRYFSTPPLDPSSTTNSMPPLHPPPELTSGYFEEDALYYPQVMPSSTSIHRASSLYYSPSNRMTNSDFPPSSSFFPPQQPTGTVDYLPHPPLPPATSFHHPSILRRRSSLEPFRDPRAYPPLPNPLPLPPNPHLPRHPHHPPHQQPSATTSASPTSLSSSLYRISFIETNAYIPQDVPSSSASPDHIPSHHRFHRHMHGEWVTETVSELKKLFKPPSGVILVNVEKKSRYPFIIFGPLIPTFDTTRFLPTPTYNILSNELRINDGIYDICGVLARPLTQTGTAEEASTATGSQAPSGYVVSAFQTFPGEDSERLEENWVTWTGAQLLYKYLPLSAGLRRLIFYKRHDLHLLKTRQRLLKTSGQALTTDDPSPTGPITVNSGDPLSHVQDASSSEGEEVPLISYVLLCECLSLSESILTSVCAVIDQLRARCCGYSALYVDYSMDYGQPIPPLPVKPGATSRHQVSSSNVQASDGHQSRHPY